MLRAASRLPEHWCAFAQLLARATPTSVACSPTAPDTLSSSPSSSVHTCLPSHAHQQQRTHSSTATSSRGSCLPSSASPHSPLHVCTSPQQDSSHSCWSTARGQVRGQKVLRRTFELPPAVQAFVDAKLQQVEEAKASQAPPEVPFPSPQPLTARSRRVGCIAYKAGMTQEWDEHGVRVPLTVLWIDNCQVIDMRWKKKHGREALVLGAGHSKQKSLNPAEAGFFIKQGVPFKRQVFEFPVSVDGRLPVGFEVTSAHYVPGQTVDVVGWTKWKGFQGVMKKWNFKGMPATHGVSLSHRHGGAIGGRTDPGKVWKGKKMPGNMGDERRTVHDCLVYKVDTDRNLVYIKGQVPGPAGRMVLLRDALNVKHDVRASWGLPFPTFVPVAEPEKSEVKRGVRVYQQPNALDPYRAYADDSDYFGVKWKKSD